MKKCSLSLMLIVFVLFSQFAFSEIKFSSPVPGVWGNKQMLIIDNIEEGEYYYSVDGSDPEKFGFAYDGPVLLDIAGDVELKVTHVSLHGAKDYGNVKYSVVSNGLSDKLYSDFIQTFADIGYYDYNSKGALKIPPSLTFSLEKNPKNFINGIDLSIASDSVLSRLIPCSVFDGINNITWRFFIKTGSKFAGFFTKREVPFSIDNWNTINFKSSDFIYKIDDDYWGQPSGAVEIDRTEDHRIYWQSINYNIGNSVESIILPAKPELKSETRADGSICFYVDGDDSYALSLVSESEKENETHELFSEICVDTFFGDKISGTLQLGVFSDSIYQGTVEVSYNIDKLPPSKPIIDTSAKTFYSRNSVDFDIIIEDEADLYVSVSEPFVIENSETVYKADSPLFYDINMSEYQLCENDFYNSTLESQDNKVLYYKILAYSQKGKMKSPIVEYSVIIDKSSYYFNSSASESLGEGTLLNPFTNFTQCLEAFKDIRSVSLRVKGELKINSRYEINSNLKIINNGDAKIVFGPEGSVDLNGSSLEIDDCRIQKVPSSSMTLILPLFKLNKGSIDLKKCQISGDFSKNATIIDCVNSIVNVDGSIISISSDSYASFISSIDSRLAITNSSISVTSDTCVVISASSGDITVNGNNFSIMGNLGRIAELFGVNATFENNEFKADLYNTSKSIKPIFANKKTNLTEKENALIGF